MSETSDQGMDPLVAGRREHHQEILESGGYPHRYQRSHSAAELHEKFADLVPGSDTDTSVTVAGRLMLHRSFGKLQFGTLQDDTGTIQLFVDRATIGDGKADGFTRVDLGDWLGATGTIMTTRKGELSVRINDYVILQKSLRPLPDKWHGLQDIELRSRRRYLDLMVNDEARRVARARATVISELRRQFEARGFVEVETPVLLHQATGATARPFATHHHALDMEMYLRIATELYLKRLVVGGMEKVFEIGRIFRNEGIDSTHNPEFTMLEAYQALADYTDMMGLIEEVVSDLTREVIGGTSLTYQGRDLDLSRPFRRASMIELVSEKLGRDVDLDTPVERPGLSGPRQRDRDRRRVERGPDHLRDVRGDRRARDLGSDLRHPSAGRDLAVGPPQCGRSPSGRPLRAGDRRLGIRQRIQRAQRRR